MRTSTTRHCRIVTMCLHPPAHSMPTRAVHPSLQEGTTAAFEKWTSQKRFSSTTPEILVRRLRPQMPNNGTSAPNSTPRCTHRLPSNSLPLPPTKVPPYPCAMSFVPDLPARTFSCHTQISITIPVPTNHHRTWGITPLQPMPVGLQIAQDRRFPSHME